MRLVGVYDDRKYRTRPFLYARELTLIGRWAREMGINSLALIAVLMFPRQDIYRSALR